MSNVLMYPRGILSAAIEKTGWTVEQFAYCVITRTEAEVLHMLTGKTRIIRPVLVACERILADGVREDHQACWLITYAGQSF